MSRHLKNIVISGLKNTCATFVKLSPDATPHTRGVRYFYLAEGIQTLRGAMDLIKIGSQRRKRIVVRPSRFRPGLHELYTYHFPTHWSDACVANRELIKIAQRQAHALEHDHSYAAIEWRVRFLKHYFLVFKGGAEPEPGLKPYSRFYQYTYVAIYRQLQAARDAALQNAHNSTDKPLHQSQTPLSPTAEDITFEPINPRPLRALRSYPMRHVMARKPALTPASSVPKWQEFCKILA